MSEQEEVTTGDSPQQTRSAKARQIVSSQESFDRYISYPLAKDGVQSPDIVGANKEFVSPDELFGPVSPSRSQGFHESVHDNGRKRNARMNHREAPKDEMYDSNPRKGQHRPRNQNTSPSNNTEAPLRSYSRFESVARNDVNHTDSHTSSTNSNHDNTSPRRRTDTNNTDRFNNLRTSSMNVTRNNVNNVRAKLDQNNGSQNGFQTGPSYNHTHILDDNLNISDSKLDTTLLRLFSRNSHGKGNYSNYDKHPGPQLNYSHSDFINLEPVMWRVHPMTATHKETLDREMDFIAFHVQPREIISRLYKDGVLTPMDYNQLSRTEGQGDKAVTRLMIRTLQRRGSMAYPALVKALLASEYFFVCERLSNSEHDLHRGMFTDRAESDWRSANIQATPYRIQTPFRRLSPGYPNNTSAFPLENVFASNQNETWPLANHISPNDHVSPLYNSMSAKNTTPAEDVLVHDLHVLGPSRLEQRLDDLDAGFRTILKEIASLKTDTQHSSPDHVLPTTLSDTQHSSPDHVLPRHRVTRKGSFPRGSDESDIDHGTKTQPAPRANDALLTYSHSLENQLDDLKIRLTELRDHVAGLTVAVSGASRVENGPIRFSRSTKESVSSNQKARSVRQATRPNIQVTYHKNAEEQMRQLQEKLKDIRRDIMALTASTTHNIDSQVRDSLQGSDLELKELADDHRRLLAEKLDSHLTALRSEIKMLHDDVTALKMARSFSSTPRRNSPQRSTLGDQLDYPDTSFSHIKHHSLLDINREKSDISYYNANLGPIPQPSFTRYPSRYSPRDPEFGKSKSERMTKGLGDRRKATGNMSNSRNSDNRNIKNRKSIQVDGRKGYKENDDWFFSKDDEILSQEKDEVSRNKDDRLFKADNSYTGSHESYAKNVDELSFENGNPRVLNNSTSSPVKNNGDSSKSKSYDSLDTRRDRVPKYHQHYREPPPEEEDTKPHPKHDRYYFSTKHDDIQSFTNNGDRVEPKMTDDVSPPSRKTNPPPVPIIITPNDRYSEEPSSPPRAKNTLSAPDDAPPPREKKKVRYDTNYPDPDYARNQRFNQARPMSRAANPAHRRVDTNRGVHESRRPPSPTDSVSSEESQYVRLTTPTRILSPPNEASFERVTTPYKILRNPNNRKMTTWSRRSALRNK